MNEQPIRLLLVDDHYVVRLGLVSSLNAEPGFTVAGEADNGHDALTAYQELQPDLVIMDWRLPETTGGEVIKSLRKLDSKAKVLVLSAFDDTEIIYQAMQSGAVGYLPKSSRRGELINAVHAVLRGENILPPGMASKLARRLARPSLSPRELEVVRELVCGNSNKEISSNLGISENTVKIHLARIMQKLDAKDRTHAASLALQRGLVS